MKKNVLQFIGSFHQGGSERQAVQLSRLLKEDGTHEVFAATLNRKGVLLSEMEAAGFDDITEFSLTSFFNSHFLKQIRNCANFLKKNKIDVVHTHDFYTNVFGILSARLAKTPSKIASKRETSGFRTPKQDRIEKFVFGRADKIVANSESVKNFLTDRHIAADRIRVIYNGLDFERLSPTETNRDSICENLGLPRSGKIRFITHVANLHHPVKNQELVLRAAQKICAEDPRAHFVFAGEGERKHDLIDLASDFGVRDNVHFIGLCNRIPELLHISYACVLTSFAEGFSNSILEYMSASKPVVATNVGGAAEAIVQDKTGFLIDSNDDFALAERLIKLLSDPERAAKMGEAGRRVIEEKFSLERQLGSTLELYDSF